MSDAAVGSPPSLEPWVEPCDILDRAADIISALPTATSPQLSIAAAAATVAGLTPAAEQAAAVAEVILLRHLGIYEDEDESGMSGVSAAAWARATELSDVIATFRAAASVARVAAVSTTAAAVSVLLSADDNWSSDDARDVLGAVPAAALSARTGIPPAMAGRILAGDPTAHKEVDADMVAGFVYWTTDILRRWAQVQMPRGEGKQQAVDGQSAEK